LRLSKEKGELAKILITIVDDDCLVRLATTNLLQSHGFTVEAFVSVEHFLENGSLNKTACLLLDVQMPGMSGIDLQYHLALIPDHCIPIIFVSSFTDPALRKHAFMAGAVAFLEKPVREEDLFEALRTALYIRGISWNGNLSKGTAERL